MNEVQLSDAIASCSKISVLLIEDEPETAEHMAVGLESRGFRVEAVQDGAAGLERALAGTFDVIIVDRMLPKLDGLTLVQCLRDAQVQTPVLFVTAMGTVAD
ncbi:hypothetical protein DBR41_29820, partial [Pseudomonas sp. HMWF010]